MHQMFRASALTVILAATAVASLMPLAAAAASVTFTSSAGVAGFHDPVMFDGSLAADPGCLDGRTVVLQRRPSLAAPWEDLADALTDDEGAFTFAVRPAENHLYRASIPQDMRAGLCPEAASPEVEVRVRAQVTTSFGRDPAPASRCVPVTVAVRPAKPGQEVLLQRWIGDRWRTVDRPVLNDQSRGRSLLCPGWEDLGRWLLRARWRAQDDRNLGSLSSAETLRIVKAGWMKRIDRLTRGTATGVSVREAGEFLYRRRDTVRRTPASNEKLLLSMAILDALGPDRRLPTRALAPAPDRGVIRGNLWIVGQGNPAVGPGAMRRLANEIAAAGIRRITGRVMGSRAYFSRDWWATGWRSYFPGRYVARPTALTYQGNQVRDPEGAAAKELTRRLRAKGVRIRKRAGSGVHSRGLEEVARIGSRPLSGLLAITNHASSNFYAEVLGKRLGVAHGGTPGTIGKGAAAIAAFIRQSGAAAATYDSSGLSYANRIAPAVVARLLGKSEAAPWGGALRDSLPPGGRGTLSHRLHDVPVRAKTGTLTEISALSGWVLARRTGTWIEFSIISRGLPTGRAKDIEDRIATTLYRAAA